MALYSGMVDLHKRSVKKLIYASDITLNVRLLVPRVASGVNPLFGDMSRETNMTGEIKGPFPCLWYDALNVRNVASSGINAIEKVVDVAAAGQFRNATAFAEVWLDDVLIDSNEKAGQTWFDKALNVVSQGRLYTVLGYAKLGLSVAVPYGLIVALEGGLGYDDDK